MEKKNQHYIPKFYLKGFIPEHIIDEYGYDNDSLPLWTYNRMTNTIKRKGIGKILKQTHYYSTVLDDNKYDFWLEDQLSMIENEFSKLINKISNNINQYFSGNKTDPFSADDRLLLTVYILWQYKRVPKIVDTIHEKISTSYKEINEKMKYDFSKEDFNKIVKNSTIKILRMVGSSNNYEMYDLIFRRNWHFIKITNERTQFITSDNPILVTNQNKDNGIKYADTEISLILNRTTAIALYGFGTNVQYHHLSDRKSIRNINKSIASNSYKYVISGSPEILENICKNKFCNVT